MSYSYNGWYASPNLPTRPLVVAGESFIPGVLDNDDVFTVLQYVAEQMHARVEPIVREDWHQADDWGFSYRETTNDNSLSCHASGTAIDYNATRHPYNVAASANFTMTQIATIHEIIDPLPIVWGGDYRYSVDAMHFEIMGSKDAVAAAADRIRNKTNEDEMAVYEDLLNRLENKLDKVLEKLEGSRQREIVTNRQLREVRDSLDADSPIRNKLDKIIDALDT